MTIPLPKKWDKKMNSLIEKYRHSFIFYRYSDRLFQNVRFYMMFLGYAHSGHSLVGALLDAHPNMIVSNELHALPLFEKYHYDKYKIFKLILDNSIQCAKKQERINTGYNYYIPILYQGTYKKLEVIGDKKGGASSVYTMKHPGTMEHLISVLGTSLKVIHVIRNPYDNISAYAYRQKKEIDRALIEKYFQRVDTVLHCKSKLPEDQFYTLFYEELTQNKERELSKLCNFLNQEATPEYLTQCSQSIYDSPHKRRYRTTWTSENKQLVKTYMNSDAYRIFFAKYEF